MLIPQNRMTDEQDLVQQVENASPAQLHAMLLGAGQKFLRLAIMAVDGGDTSSKSRHFSRVSEIILELSGRLNPETGGELAENLARIYDGWIDVVFDAGQKNQTDRLNVVLDQMGEMQATWEEFHLNSVSLEKTELAK